MVPTLQTSNQLFVLRRKGYERLLAPGVAGTPTPVAADGIVVRMQYIEAGSEVDEAVRLAEPMLQHDHCHLLFLFQNPDGPPFRSAKVFVDEGIKKISWIENSHTHHSAEVRHFRAVAAGEAYSWEKDALAGRQGYFLTGHGRATHLLRVARWDIDVFGRRLFTAVPVELPSGLPRLDLSSMNDGLLAAELTAQYGELQGAVARHSYRDVVTKARNITEGLLGLVLTRAGETPGRDLFDHLRKLRDLAEQRRSPLSDLAYHLAHKIRLLHARTHPGAVVSQGRPVSPELALSVLEDMKEILAELRLTQA